MNECRTILARIDPCRTLRNIFSIIFSRKEGKVDSQLKKEGGEIGFFGAY